MKIAFDLHGTVDKNQFLWKSICASLDASEIDEVFLISGPPKDQILSELFQIGNFAFPRENIISVVDFLKSKQIKLSQDHNGHYWTDEDIWWKSKAKICEEFDIDFLFDNEIRYKKYFDENHKTKFILVSQ